MDIKKLYNNVILIIQEKQKYGKLKLLDHIVAYEKFHHGFKFFIFNFNPGSLLFHVDV
jgi:hypothetical protein